MLHTRITIAAFLTLSSAVSAAEAFARLSNGIDDGPLEVNYAMGLHVAKVNGETMIGHTGGWVAFTSIYHRYPALYLSVVAFCNSTEVLAPELGQKNGIQADSAIAARTRVDFLIVAIVHFELARQSSPNVRPA